MEALEVVVSQLKHSFTISVPTPSTLPGPQFSLSVGGDCLEGWSEDTVSQTAGCPELGGGMGSGPSQDL